MPTCCKFEKNMYCKEKAVYSLKCAYYTKFVCESHFPEVERNIHEDLIKKPKRIIYPNRKDKKKSLVKKNLKGSVIWFTGLCGSGKTTLAKKIKNELEQQNYSVKLLDGDEIRCYLTSDLSFSKKDRDENIKRISYVAKCIADVNGIALVSAISPYVKAREEAKSLIGEDRFFEVFVDCSLNELINRDVKGLYKKALNGEIDNFTGVNDPYEEPDNPYVIVNTGIEDVEDSFKLIYESLTYRHLG